LVPSTDKPLQRKEETINGNQEFGKLGLRLALNESIEWAHLVWTILAEESTEYTWNTELGGKLP
jgi:hypothetical protein